MLVFIFKEKPLELYIMSSIKIKLKDIISDKQLTFLAGAGCSRNSPSNLPTGNQMMKIILKFSCHIDYLSNILELVDKGTLRFESLIEIFQDLLDKEVNCIKYYSICDKPNSLHYFLATMINRGHFVTTTNFDCLIEYALLHSSAPKDEIVPIITKEDYNRCNDPYGLLNAGMKVIYKIHGSYKNIITQEITKNSLITTISSLSKGKVSKDFEV